MKVDTDKLVDTLSKIKDALVYDLIKGGTYSEWNRGISCFGKGLTCKELPHAVDVLFILYGQCHIGRLVHDPW